MKKLRIILKSQNQEELTKRSSFKWNTWLLISTKLVLQAKSTSDLSNFLLFFFFSLKTWKFLFLFFSLKIWTKFPLRKPKREPWKMSLKINIYKLKEGGGFVTCHHLHQGFNSSSKLSQIKTQPMRPKGPRLGPQKLP